MTVPTVPMTEFLRLHRLKVKHSQLLALQSVKKAKVYRSKKTILRHKLADLKTRLADFLGGTQLQFVVSQLECAKKKPKGFRWTNADKALALSLVHCSPKCYRMLRKALNFPSVSTLKKVMRNIQVYPGLNMPIIQALKLKAQGWSDQNKLVVLAIDEMKLRPAVSYDKGRDMVEGFCGERSHLASHALVIMVRGIAEKWKQSVGYFLSSSPISGTEMKDILLDCVGKLEDIGLTVMAVIGDQGSNNQNLFGTVLKATPEKPYFLYKDRQIFLIYDPPHMLKNIRNNLKNHGYIVKGHDISWVHIREFYDKDSSKPIRLAPKLTSEHIELPAFSHLRVYLAAQILSHSLASGMKVMAQWGLISDEAKYTADFLDMFDKLFNSFNSRELSSAAQMHHALSPTSGHKVFLEEAWIWLATVRSKGSRQPACLKGWRMAITALLQLWEILHRDHEFKFLLTNRINQDCVENLFSVIRAKMGPNDRPNATQFRVALAQTMVDSVMLSGSNSNCKEDVDNFLLTLTRERQSPTPFVLPTAATSQYQAMISQLPDEVKSIVSVCTFPHLEEQETLDNQEINVLTYIAGYIVRKLRQKICDTCLACLVCEDENDNEHLVFLREKAYKDAKDGLISPSQALVNIVAAMEKKYREVIDDVLHLEGVKCTLVNTMIKHVSFADLGCGDCKLDILISHMMINVRLHHSIREANRKLASKDQINKKILKFA